jgi:hypothetical protein
LAGVLCQPQPEPIVQKCKPATTAPDPLLRKTLGKRGRGRKPLDSGAQTFAVELTLAKPVKCSKNFVAKSSGFSIAEKAIVVDIRIDGKKTYSTSAGGSGAARAPTRALDLFGSGSSASNDETPL